MVASRTAGGIAIAAGAGIWGLFWIPLRYLDQQGVEGLWAVALALFSTLAVALPIAVWKGRDLRQNARWLFGFGTGIGLATVLYFAAVIFSDVVRVVFLFYLLPIWATLLARLLHGEKIHRRKLLAIGIAFAGLFLLLGGESGLPIPRNLGDWFALASGFFWALSLTLIRSRPGIDPYTSAAAPFVFGAPLALVLAALVIYGAPDAVSAVPRLETIMSMLPVSILYGCLLLWPSMFAQVWGARLVAAPTAALLTMTEILVATFSAWLLIGSTLAPLALVGSLLILTAAILDLTTISEEPVAT